MHDIARWYWWHIGWRLDFVDPFLLWCLAFALPLMLVGAIATHLVLMFGPWWLRGAVACLASMALPVMLLMRRN